MVSSLPPHGEPPGAAGGPPRRRYVLPAQTLPYCVYSHAHGDVVFYIGCGSLGRPFQRASRTRRWYAYVAALDEYTVTILATFPTKAAAEAYEAHLIATTQPLCNLVGTHREGDRAWPEPGGLPALEAPTVPEYQAVLQALLATQRENAGLRQRVTPSEARPRWPRVLEWCSGALPSMGAADGASHGAPETPRTATAPFLTRWGAPWRWRRKISGSK